MAQFRFLWSTDLVQWRSNAKASGPVKWLHDTSVTRRLRNSASRLPSGLATVQAAMARHELSDPDSKRGALRPSNQIVLRAPDFWRKHASCGISCLVSLQGGATKQQQEEASNTHAEAARKSCAKNRFDGLGDHSLSVKFCEAARSVAARSLLFFDNFHCKAKVKSDSHTIQICRLLTFSWVFLSIDSIQITSLCVVVCVPWTQERKNFLTSCRRNG